MRQVLAAGGALGGAAIQGVDLREVEVDWRAADVADAVFLGCRFPAGTEELLRERGAYVFPPFAPRPYDPFRRELYTPAELEAPAEGGGTVDESVYAWYLERGRAYPDVVEALAQRLHDHAIDDALGDAIGETIEDRLERRIVAIMGGHSAKRDAPAFRGVAHVAWGLARRGYLVTTGGGPGIMEAGNLGAYMSNRPAGDLDEALDMLAEAPAHDSPRYREAARDVAERFPGGAYSVAVPTWFYGHEPTNLFSGGIAKYFSNSLREDGLLALALHGIVFAPGSAGTLQEVFQDAAQNHYATFGYRSPMAFLGREAWTPADRPGAYALLEAVGERYRDLLTLSDDPEEIVRFIAEHPPVKPSE